MNEKAPSKSELEAYILDKLKWAIRGNSFPGFDTRTSKWSAVGRLLSSGSTYSWWICEWAGVPNPGESKPDKRKKKGTK